MAKNGETIRIQGSNVNATGPERGRPLSPHIARNFVTRAEEAWKIRTQRAKMVFEIRTRIVLKQIRVRISKTHPKVPRLRRSQYKASCKFRVSPAPVAKEVLFRNSKRNAGIGTFTRKKGISGERGSTAGIRTHGAARVPWARDNSRNQQVKDGKGSLPCSVAAGSGRPRPRSHLLILMRKGNVDERRRG